MASSSKRKGAPEPVMTGKIPLDKKQAKHQCLLFTGTFRFHTKDPDGRKFDKVSRFFGECEEKEISLVIDVNVDVYPIQLNIQYDMILASTLDIKGLKPIDFFEPSIYGRGSLMDGYEYVCHGKIFKMKETSHMTCALLISFGGLMCKLEGSPDEFKDILVDKFVFLLLRKSHLTLQEKLKLEEEEKMARQAYYEASVLSGNLSPSVKLHKKEDGSESDNMSE